jgi:hypothetical protein
MRAEEIAERSGLDMSLRWLSHGDVTQLLDAQQSERHLAPIVPDTSLTTGFESRQLRMNIFDGL